MYTLGITELSLDADIARVRRLQPTRIKQVTYQTQFVYRVFLWGSHMENMQSYRIASMVPQSLLLQMISPTCSPSRLTVQLDKHLRTPLILVDDAASSPVSRHNRPSLVALCLDIAKW